MGGRDRGRKEKGKGEEEVEVGRREVSKPSHIKSWSQKRFEAEIPVPPKLCLRGFKTYPRRFVQILLPLTVWIWCKGRLFSRNGQLPTPAWSEIEISYLKADGSGEMFLVPLTRPLNWPLTTASTALHPLLKKIASSFRPWWKWLLLRQRSPFLSDIINSPHLSPLSHMIPHPFVTMGRYTCTCVRRGVCQHHVSPATACHLTLWGRISHCALSSTHRLADCRANPRPSCHTGFDVSGGCSNSGPHAAQQTLFIDCTGSVTSFLKEVYFLFFPLNYKIHLGKGLDPEYQSNKKLENT